VSIVPASAAADLGSSGLESLGMRRDLVDWFEVIARIESGDRASLLRLTSLISSILTRLGAYRHADSHDDLMQDVALALIQSVRRDAISDPARFVGYAWTVAKNRLIDQAALRTRRGLQSEQVELEQLSAGDADPSRSVEKGFVDPGLRMDLQRGLQDLPADERLVVEEIYLKGNSYSEVSKQLGLPLGTVKRRQWNGLRRLRVAVGLSPSTS